MCLLQPNSTTVRMLTSPLFSFIHDKDNHIDSHDPGNNVCIRLTLSALVKIKP